MKKTTSRKVVAKKSLTRKKIGSNTSRRIGATNKSTKTNLVLVLVLSLVGVFLLYVSFRKIASVLGASITVYSGSSIQGAISLASAGDTITVKTGNYGTERLNINKSITVKCETKHACIIKGAVLTGNAVLDGFYSLNSNTNDGAIVMTGSGNVTKNNKVEGSCMVGIKLEGSSNLAEGNEILKSRQCSGSSGPDSDGIRFFGSNQVMRGNYIHDILFTPPFVANTKGIAKPPHIDCFQTWGNGVVDNIYDAVNATIENNICDNYDAALNTLDKEGTQGANLEDCDGCRFTHNYIHVYGKSILWEESSINGKAEYNIIVSGPVIPNTSSGQYGLFGNSPAVANYNIFRDFKNSGANALVGSVTGTGNVKSAGDLMLDANYKPAVGSPACIIGGSYAGAYPCGVTTTATPTPTPTPTPTATPIPTTTATPTTTAPTVSLSPTKATITIYAGGTKSASVYPKMALEIDGKTVATWSNINANANANNRQTKIYAYSTSTPVTGKTIKVKFTNDYHTSSSDRNLFVDKIVVNGKTIQTEDIKTYSVGSWTESNGCGAGNKQSEWLNCNGYFQYPVLAY